jgi:predicted  nucleic acid-binding Zn-ribbon protein
VVLDILLTTINTIVKSVVDIEQAVIKNNSETINKTVTKINHELYSNKAELDKIQSLKVGLYSDYKEDVLSLEDYKEMKKRFENKECQINQNIIQLEEQIKALKNGRGLDSKVINLYKNYMGIDNLNREIVGNLVN